MKAAVSVHVDIREAQQSRTAVYSDDSADGAGRQEITISGGEHAIVLVVGKVTYIKGNKAALAGYFGFPAAAAGRLVNRWISFRPGDTGYQQLTSGVTLAGLASELELTGPLTIKAPGMVAGQSAVGVHGTVPTSVGAPAGSKATLYVAAGGRALPVSYQLDRAGQPPVRCHVQPVGRRRCTLLRRCRRSRSPRSRSDREGVWRVSARGARVSGGHKKRRRSADEAGGARRR